jgi:hypothetical protein
MSGALLFSVIHLRSYQNIFFRAKMLMVLLAGLKRVDLSLGRLSTGREVGSGRGPA